MNLTSYLNESWLDQISTWWSFYYFFGSLVIVGCANAVNLTDGLDGLAIGPIMISALSFAFITYFTGNLIYSEYLKIPYISDTGELVIICAALIGSGLGFLWYNAPPAMVFMGDTGSLSMGGTIGAMAVATKHEIILVIIGGVFVLEALSVFAQVISFKLTGKRIFRMAPIHHHFEQKGWSESTIVIRFWIIAIILALLGLASLKLRWMLQKKIKASFSEVPCTVKLNIISSNKPFYTKSDKFLSLLEKSIYKVTKKKPILSTTGGTSDARFIKDICPVYEFGSVGKTMHQINENIDIKDLENLQQIYEDLILSYNDIYGWN